MPSREDRKQLEDALTRLESADRGAAGAICRLAMAMLWIELDVHYRAQLDGKEIDLIRVKRIGRTAREVLRLWSVAQSRSARTTSESDVRDFEAPSRAAKALLDELRQR